MQIVVSVHSKKILGGGSPPSYGVINLDKISGDNFSLGNNQLNVDQPIYDSMAVGQQFTLKIDPVV